MFLMKARVTSTPKGVISKCLSIRNTISIALEHTQSGGGRVGGGVGNGGGA